MRTRVEIDDLLDESPSVRSGLADEVRTAEKRAAKFVALDLADRGEPAGAVELRIREGSYSVDQVIGDWFPDEAAG